MRFFVNLASQAENKGTVLVLNSRDGWKPAMLLNSEGEQEELACFEQNDNTEAYESCSINWENQLYIFGGRNERRQISRLNGYKVERIGTLPFDQWIGGCTVMANQFIFLCFNNNYNDYKRCRRSTGPLETFSEVPLAQYSHSDVPPSSSESKSSCLISR